MDAKDDLIEVTTESVNDKLKMLHFLEKNEEENAVVEDTGSTSIKQKQYYATKSGNLPIKGQQAVVLDEHGVGRQAEVVEVYPGDRTADVQLSSLIDADKVIEMQPLK
jgi:hypothetical protein